MGKAARWFRNLWGGGGKKEQGREQGRAAAATKSAPPPPDRKRWSFAKSSRDSTEGDAAATVGGNAEIAKAAKVAWLKSMYSETEREQSKHAMAVAAATAAAADAAVAAAQAAVEVVRLTSQGPPTSSLLAVLDPRGGRAAAAVKIQTAFRGFLAKKALRALKALVKLQALVRGYLVRRQAAATLQSMQALVRAQAAIRAARSSRATALPPLHLHHHPPVRPRYSLQERYMDDTRSEHGVAAYSRRLSASIESSSYGYDRSPKIVEMDTGRPKSRSSSVRTSPPVVEAGGAGEEWYANSVSSPLPPFHQLPGAPPRISAPNARHFPEYDWCALEIKARPATAQSTPRLAHMPVTPTKSVCGGGAYGASPNCRGYMSSTQSSEAKVRSQSAPKQRPEPGVAVAAAAGARKRVPLSEVTLEARASLSVVGMQRSCNRVQEAFNFKSAVLSRFDRSSEPVAERDRDLFLQRRW